MNCILYEVNLIDFMATAMKFWTQMWLGSFITGFQYTMFTRFMFRRSSHRWISGWCWWSSQIHLYHRCVSEEHEWNDCYGPKISFRINGTRQCILVTVFTCLSVLGWNVKNALAATVIYVVEYGIYYNWFEFWTKLTEMLPCDYGSVF